LRRHLEGLPKKKFSTALSQEDEQEDEVGVK
jgi:hypothetical protein